MSVSEALPVRPILAFSVATLVVAGASQRLQAQHALGAVVNHVVSAGGEGAASIIVDEIGTMTEKQSLGGIDATFSDANWISMGGIPGANGRVSAAVTDSAGNLYIGGEFTAVGNVVASHIAKWDGNTWSTLGSGVDSNVLALAIWGTDLYAAGRFANAGGIAAANIAKWDGTNWSALGTGLARTDHYTTFVRALVVSGSDLYAGGDFTTAGGTTAKHVAKWNGSTWSPVGAGIDGAVFALAMSGNDLYAAGDFAYMTFSDRENVITNVLKWNGSNWSPVGSGMGRFGGRPTVYALAVLGSELYAGGDFTTAGGIVASNIAKWDGSSWSSVAEIGIGYNPAYIRTLAAGTDLYVSGNFSVAGGPVANQIAKWNGSSWSAVAPAIDRGVTMLAVSGQDVYAAIEFIFIGGDTSAKYIAKWDGSRWSGLGSGMTVSVAALALSRSNLYVGGGFRTPGTTAAHPVAKWNGSSWSAVGLGTASTNRYPPSVRTLAVLGDDLYVGGNFVTIGGISANHIAKWDGSNWWPLGSGMQGTPQMVPSVQALAVSGSNLYAAGYFTTAGGTPASNIAKWNGSSWSALGSGVNFAVIALAVSGSDLYAAGYFTTARDTAANHIAKWDGSIWSPLGAGTDRPVYALATSGTGLYAGGIFTTAGGTLANTIAKWDRTSWSALGSGMATTDGFTTPYVSSLAVSGHDLYASGHFMMAGGIGAANIAKWNGSNWSPLGSGLDGGAGTLLVSASDLYAAGWFTIAGGKVSGSIARVRIGSIATSLVITDSTASIEFCGVTGYQYDVERAGNLNLPLTWTTLTPDALSPADDGSFTFVDTNRPPGTAYYRAVERCGLVMFGPNGLP